MLSKHSSPQFCHVEEIYFNNLLIFPMASLCTENKMQTPCQESYTLWSPLSRMFVSMTFGWLNSQLSFFNSQITTSERSFTTLHESVPFSWFSSTLPHIFLAFIPMRLIKASFIVFILKIGKIELHDKSVV